MWWPCYTSSTSPSRSTSWYYTYLWSHAIQGGGQAVKQISAVMILGPVWMQITSTSVYMPDRAPHSVAFLCYWWMGWWYQYCALSTKVSVIYMMCRGVDIDIDASIWISMHLYGFRCIAYLSMHRRQFLCISLALTAYMSSTCVYELVCNEDDVYDMNIVMYIPYIWNDASRRLRTQYGYRCIYMDFDASLIHRCIKDNFNAYRLYLLRMWVRHV